jgi:hypothetical protein
MERLTTWRSSLWVRWLGWTVLYAVVSYGVVTRGDQVGLLHLAALALVAFSIGVRLRSGWWALSPLTAFIGLLATLWVKDFMTITYLLPPKPPDHGGGLDDVALVISFLFFVALGLVCAIPAWAGVWWGKRREATVDDSPFERA